MKCFLGRKTNKQTNIISLSSWLQNFSPVAQLKRVNLVLWVLLLLWYFIYLLFYIIFLVIIRNTQWLCHDSQTAHEREQTQNPHQPPEISVAAHTRWRPHTFSSSWRYFSQSTCGTSPCPAHTLQSYHLFIYTSLVQITKIHFCSLKCLRFLVKVSFWHHQSPQRPRLDGDDGCSTWSVVHERQLTETALIIVFAHTATHTVLLHLDIIHSSETERYSTQSSLKIRVNFKSVFIFKSVITRPLDDVEIVSIVSLVYDVLVRLHQHLEHGVQHLGELLLKPRQKRGLWWTHWVQKRCTISFLMLLYSVGYSCKRIP